MTSATRRAKLEYLSGVKTLGEAARLQQGGQAAALLAAVRPEEASCSEFGELLFSLGSGWNSWASLHPWGTSARAQRVAFWGPSWRARVPQDAASRPLLAG